MKLVEEANNLRPGHRKPLFTGCPLPPMSPRFPRYYDIICSLACGTLNVGLGQTMLSGTLSHPNVAYTLSYRLMADASRMLAVISCVAAFTVSGCAAEPTQITILATNDMHGGIEPNRSKDGTVEGGLAAFSGTVQAIKVGLRRKLGDRAGVLVLDAGDQFQGTLISNHNEGRLVFQAMSQAGYDVAITGNHDYDFGPVGWLEDEVTPTTVDQDPRGALKAALAYARFPLVSANTFLRSSLHDTYGNLVQVDPQGCVPHLDDSQKLP